MKLSLSVRDQKGHRRISEESLPLSVGNGSDADIQVQFDGPTQVVAHIGQAEGALFLQPTGELPIRYNGQATPQSVWLTDGDIIDIDESSLACRLDNEHLTITVQAPGVYKGIQPSVFRNQDKNLKTPFPFLRIFAVLFLLGVFAIVGICAGFLYLSKRLTVVTDPPVPELKLKGGLAKWQFGEKWYILPGDYSVSGEIDGYHPLDQKITVGEDKSQSMKILLEKLPGFISVKTEPSPATVWVGSFEKQSPLDKLEIAAGEYLIQVNADRHQPFSTNVTMQGLGKALELDVSLLPNWAEVKLPALPDGMVCLVDGKPIAPLPQTLELDPGLHTLAFSKPLHNTWQTQFVVSANAPLSFNPVELELSYTMLDIVSEPAGANVTINGAYVGQTPTQAEIPPNEALDIQIVLGGHFPLEFEKSYPPGTNDVLSVKLQEEIGVVQLNVTPSDAVLFIDGEEIGQITQAVELPCIPLELEFRRAGYESAKVNVTPRPGLPSDVSLTLKSIAPIPSTTSTNPSGTRPGTESSAPDLRSVPKEIMVGDYRMRKVVSASYTMGASRREQGRRANETLRTIQLQRPFFMGVTEVSNSQFKQFDPSYNSGSFSGQDLTGAPKPVSNVSWEQAAAYCNWLSKKEGLPLAYRASGSTMIAAVPMNTGYRLPSEAEWEYCARATPEGGLLRYPWGATMPPPANSGNYADQSAVGMLSPIISGYNDGYKVTAPCAGFAPNPLGLNDMGGNVAEWCHDNYEIYPPSPGKVYVDPLGTGTESTLHTIKGSSWAHGSISELRLSFRDYAKDRRQDVGFRICRYIQ